MDVFLMVRRKKSSIFLDAKETTTIRELKRMIRGILKKNVEEQQITNEHGTEIFGDDKTLSDCSLTSQNARAQSPATVGLCFKNENGDFESLEISPLSSPPELPEVMRSTDQPTVEAH